jgi:hypothetical protein
MASAFARDVDPEALALQPNREGFDEGVLVLHDEDGGVG